MPILPEHKELLSSQSESKTLPEWVEFFDSQYTKNQIYSFCYHNKYKIKKILKSEQNQINRQWTINSDYFKTWSNNMAYILGLWFSNGYIYGNKIFDITLHAKDKYIVKQIAKELNYKGDLFDSVDKQSVRINFSCVVIYNDIKNLNGSEENKNTFPPVPKEYLGDFIRGYFDGYCGDISFLKNKRINSKFIGQSKVFLDSLLDVLQSEAGVKGGSYDPLSQSLRFGKKDTKSIGEFMYKNDPELFLLRKREKFKSLNI